MKFFIKTLIALIISAMIFPSCEENGNGENPDNNSNTVEVTDDITEVTTWSGDSIYVIKIYDFYVNNTLSIQPGAIIKFHPDGPDMTIGSGGTIIAKGTSDNPVIFTSWRDDEHGGDTNGDEDITSPASKDWGRIGTNGNNGSEFEYCEFYYGGESSYNSTLEVYGSNIKVNNCIFAHNDGGDPTGWYGVLDATNAESNCEIKNNVFYDNIRPLSVSLTVQIDDSNLFSNPDDHSEGNQYNGIFVESMNDVAHALSWTETEVAFVIDDNDWWIREGGSLTLADNVCLKFRSDSEIVLNETNAIINYNGPGVVFTSYKDDSRKGDTNGDGDITSPGDNDWNGIYDNLTSTYKNWSNIYYDSH
ncbi:MAG TPA: hypothetical protein VJ951_15960 [Bacteroidales bacterium]|nr:hypothetical protein [Bacteroidales bacterium]